MLCTPLLKSLKAPSHSKGSTQTNKKTNKQTNKRLGSYTDHWKRAAWKSWAWLAWFGLSACCSRPAAFEAQLAEQPKIFSAKARPSAVKAYIVIYCLQTVLQSIIFASLHSLSSRTLANSPNESPSRGRRSSRMRPEHPHAPSQLYFEAPGGGHTKQGFLVCFKAGNVPNSSQSLGTSGVARMRKAWQVQQSRTPK